MEYRSFGRTGVKVSQIGLGCMMFGGRTSDADSAAIIDAAIAAGINFIDTANVYSRGKSEEAVGKALKRNGLRPRIVLATKVYNRMADDDPNAAGNSRRHVMEQCEASLKRLQTDYIDLYQVHRPQPEVPIDETLRALDDLIRAGKVRYIGTSTFAAWQVVEALYISRELGLNRFVSEQPPYNLLDRRIERELLPMAQGHGLAIVPWSPLASGFLSGKYARDGEKPPESRFRESIPWNDKHLTEAAFALAGKLVALAQAKGCTPSQLAIAWCAGQPGITCPIIGPRTMEQLKDNLESISVTLTHEDRKAIDAFAPPGRATVVYYDADFRASPYRQT
jgi:aryl-alcohol dehydrogenase-like predicted oxidoreductase